MADQALVTIAAYTDFDSLYSEIQNLNHKRVQELFKSDKVLFDNYAITDSDSDTIKRFLKESIMQITGTVDSHLDEIKIADPYGLVIKIFDANTSDSEKIKTLTKQFMIEYSLMKWYNMKGLQDESKIYFNNIFTVVAEGITDSLTNILMRKHY